MKYLDYYLTKTFTVFLISFTIVVFAGCINQKNISVSGTLDELDERSRFEYEYSLNEALKFKLLGDHARAVQFFKRCIELYPHSHVAYYELSNIYFSYGEFDLSVEYGQKALDIESGNIWYYIQLGQILYENEKFEDSFRIYKEAIQIFRDNLKLKFTLAAMLTERKEYNEALVIYDELESLIGIDERIYLSRQQIYMEKGQFEKAYDILGELILNFPEEPRYYGILAELYVTIGMYDEALDTYDQLFEIDPFNGNAQLSIAEFFLHKGNNNKAFNYYKEAFRNPSLEFNEKIRIYNSMASGNSPYDYIDDHVIELGKILIDEYPGEDLAKIVLSEKYISAGFFAEGRDLLYSLYINGMDNQALAEQLISVTGFSEDYDMVIDLGEEFLKLYDQSAIIYYFTGVAHHVKNNTDKALEIFLEAIDFLEHDNEFLVHIYSYLGDIYNEKNDYINSDKYFNLAIELDNENLLTLNNYAYYLSIREEKLETA
ncbi:MAG: tetratricopeptide repeat protein, partial [Cyclobacteriaceae bacterium]